jgi:hypothetical protein
VEKNYLPVKKMFYVCLNAQIKRAILINIHVLHHHSFAVHTNNGTVDSRPFEAKGCVKDTQFIFAL